MDAFSGGFIIFGESNPKTDMVEGPRTSFYSNGDTHFGLWKNGVKNGLGDLIYSDLSVHSGRWTEANKDGPFTYVDSSGT